MRFSILLAFACFFALPVWGQSIVDPDQTQLAPMPGRGPGVPSLFDIEPAGEPPPEASEEPPDIEAQFQDFPRIEEEELLKPGRLVTKAQKRVELRKVRSKAETEEAVLAAREAARESPTFEGRRLYMTEYYQLLCNRMRELAPKLRPEIDRIEVDSIEALNDLPGDPNDTLDAYMTPR